MYIRSITCFCNPSWPLSEKALGDAGKFIFAAKEAYTAAGFEVQTTRLATVPFPNLVPVGQVPDLAKTLERMAQAEGFQNLSLGPAFPDRLEYYPAIVESLAATENTFFSGLLTKVSQGHPSTVSLSAVRACAQVIAKSSTLKPNGFANLRFAALANVPPGSPFFPAAFHEGDDFAFALAIECADLAVEAFSQATTLADARETLHRSVERHAASLEKVASDLTKAYAVQFKGLDFTLAPFPEELRSIGTAIERMGVPAVGLAGTLTAAAIITSTLDRARYTRTGFNGLMLPVLEDFTLAARAAQGLLSVYDLLLYSSVCGTGVDTLPLPGNTPQAHIAGLLLDIASLALRLNKPLTARLLPVPGKMAGETTDFDFPYFANSRILSLPALELKGKLAGNENIEIPPFHR